MTYVSFAAGNAARYERQGLYQNLLHHSLPGIAVLGLSALVGAGMLYMHPPAQRSAEQVAETIATVEPVTQRLAAVEKVFADKKFVAPTLREAPKKDASPRSYASVLDPTYTFGLAPVPFKAKSAIASALEPTPMVPPPLPSTQDGAPMSDSDEVPPPIVANLEPAVPLSEEAAPSDVPLPLPRPHELRLPTDVVSAPAPVRGERQRLANVAPTASAPAAAAPQSGGFFEKLFGGASRPPGPALAYASPEDGGGILGGLSRLGGARPAPINDRFTAVYDISAHTVHLPDGSVLEAHSGIGYMQDNPQYVDQRMRGATPPAVYELTEREALFHGVRALRLTPVQGDTFGRAGLLAHTFMLGPSGNSNGCVVFRNYDRFLQAYLRGDIKHLAVVAKL